MRLTSYTDYSLRTLMYLALNRDELVTIQDIADAHQIAKNHLTKVVHHLGVLGLIETVRGRNGGLRLGMEPEKINIGEVVRNTENDFHIAECFGNENGGCIYSSSCALKGALSRANNAFLAVLDGVTLDTLIAPAKSPAGKRAAQKAVPVQFKALARKAEA